MVKIICPKCKNVIEVSEDQPGEVTTCDSCKTSFIAGDVKGMESPRSFQSDGIFKEVEYKGTFYSLKMLRILKKHFSIFTVLFLFQNACFIALAKGDDSIASPVPWSFMRSISLIILTFFLLMISYSHLLYALRVKSCWFIICLFLYCIEPGMIMVMAGIRLDSAVSIIVLFVVPIVADIVLSLFFMIKAVIILKSARNLPSEGNRFVRTLKQYSFVLFPFVIFLLVSSFFLGSVERDDSLCKNCGIWVEKKSFCISHLRLLPFPKHKPTAFSRFLDPEHQCSHHDGMVALPTKSSHSSGFLGFNYVQEERKCCLSIIHSPLNDLKGYMGEYGNIAENSPLYQYLCKKNSQSFARRMISFDLSSAEIEEFFEWIRYSSWTKKSPISTGNGREACGGLKVVRFFGRTMCLDCS